MSTNRVVAYLATLITTDQSFQKFAKIIDLPEEAAANILATYKKPEERLTEALTTKSLIGDSCGLSISQIAQVGEMTDTNAHELNKIQQQQQTADLEAAVGKMPVKPAPTTNYTSPSASGSAYSQPRASGCSLDR